MLNYFNLIQLFVTLWTVACQTPLFMGFSSQEYWSGLPCPFPGESSGPRDQTHISMSPALARVTWEALCMCVCMLSHLLVSGSL